MEKRMSEETRYTERVNNTRKQLFKERRGEKKGSERSFIMALTPPYPSIMSKCIGKMRMRACD